MFSASCYLWQGPTDLIKGAPSHAYFSGHRQLLVVCLQMFLWILFSLHPFQNCHPNQLSAFSKRFCRIPDQNIVGNVWCLPPFDVERGVNTQMQRGALAVKSVCVCVLYHLNMTFALSGAELLSHPGEKKGNWMERRKERDNKQGKHKESVILCLFECWTWFVTVWIKVYTILLCNTPLC